MNLRSTAPVALVAAAAASLLSVAACRHSDQPGSPPETRLTQSDGPAAAAPLETVRGTVVELPGGRGGAGDAKGNSFQGATGPLITLRNDKETLRVHAGPPWYHQQIGLVLAVGDTIEVTGRRPGQPKGQPILLAETVTKGERTFRVRDEKGEKLWRPNIKTELPLSTISGTVVDLAPEMADHTPGRTPSGMFVTVESDQERVAVQLGPQGFRSEHGIELAVGDHVEISGWRVPGAKVIDQPLMLAASIQKGTQTLRLRDDKRLPLWPTEKKAPAGGN
jgi:hypothetical protein